MMDVYCLEKKLMEINETLKDLVSETKKISISLARLVNSLMEMDGIASDKKDVSTIPRSEDHE